MIGKIEQLKNNEQEQIAKMLEEEIKWEAILQNSKEPLAKLAKEALDEHQCKLMQKNN